MAVIITPRLLPGLQIDAPGNQGATFISVDPMSGAPGEKPLWRWYVDTPGAEFSGDDLYSWGNARLALHALVDFIADAGEAYSYHGRMESDTSTDLFPEKLCTGPHCTLTRCSWLRLTWILEGNHDHAQ